MLLEITTTGKWVLVIVAGLFIAWGLATAIFVPRRNPDFPLKLGAFITLSAVLFVAQMAAVYWVVTYQEVEHEAAHETTPTDTTDTTETTETETTETETTETETTETETAPSGGGDVAAGKELFASQGCGSCHTLADAGASGSVGPNLDETKPSYELVADRVSNGKGAMPAFDLEEQELQDISAYVSSVAGS